MEGNTPMVYFKRIRFIALLLGTLLLGSSCGDTGVPSNGALLGLAGGAGGAVLGAHLSGSGTNDKIAGALMGGLIGAPLGYLVGGQIPAGGH